jgi:uncharacterized protein YecT (DUF1311 family)
LNQFKSQATEKEKKALNKIKSSNSKRLSLDSNFKVKRQMRKIFFLLFLWTTTSSYGQTQRELNENASKQYKSADSTLNSIYKQILKTYSADTAFIRNLKTAQKLWIKFRDAELKMRFPDSYTYGSVQPMCVSFYLTDLTNDRINTLRTWVDGIEEGDVCSGSVRTKK